MEKTIKVEFAAQSKAVVEKVSIEYNGSTEEFINLSNDKILQEVIDLQLKAGSHSRAMTQYK